MKVILWFVSFIIVAVFQGCSIPVPTREEIIGTWRSSDGAMFEFRKDGSFTGQSLPGEKIFSPSDEFKNIKFNESGKWDIKYLHDRWVVNLRFDKSPSLKKGYDTRILISGSNGILENKPPWHLFAWIGDPDNGNRYKFEKGSVLKVGE